MKVLNDFECANCGTIEEHFLENDTQQCTCRSCGGVARKVRSVPNFSLPGTDPGYPTAYDQWNKKREQKMREEQKHQSS